jgi:hypothetical protein
MDLWKMSVVVNRTQENLQMKWHVVKLLNYFYQEIVFNLCYVRCVRKMVLNECIGCTYVSCQVYVYLER